MKYIFRTTKGYRLKLTALFGSVIFGTVTGAMFPFCIGKIVDQIFYIRQMKGFLLCFFLYAGLYFLNQCGHSVLNYLWAHLKITYVVDIRRQCFAHLLRLRAGVLTHIKSGDVMRRIQEDTECFLEFIHRSLFYVLANFIQLAISIGYIFYTNVYLGALTVVMTPIMAYSIRFFSAKIKEKQQLLQTKKGLADAWIQEMMMGLTELKLLNAQPRAQRQYREKTESILRDEIGAGYLSLKSETVNEALVLAGQLCLYGIAAFFVAGESMTMGQFVACAAYFSTCAAYYNALARKLTDINANLVGIRRVEEFFSWEEETDLPSAGSHSLAQGSIRFENISFGYGDGLVLKHFDLSVASGEKIAFVGKSGQGKSTLLQLLCRFHDPLEGNIYVDGKCLTDYTYASLRSQIAVVWQDNALFHGSLRKNIIFSDDKSRDPCLWKILEGLRLKELVEEFPEGLDTIMGSGGRSLSGGQKQRIAIARCICRQPKILLLDEATSALDEDTETAVNAFICQQLPDTTILSVAHRFSTVLAADKAVVMEDGHVTGFGPHDALLEQNTLYRTLWEEYQNARIREGGPYETQS